IGEHIINQAGAAKIAPRVKDGRSVLAAVDKSIAESDSLGDYVGRIAIDKHGNICSGSTSIAQSLYAYADGELINTFFQVIML
ncbi:isoaspartyl peptidase/L-asparaginase, partial [Francisella tularensis subsp. holarctica]|uniref:isoaspartyl peptidase/L-asparaginase n=1 Tax=Francisella tularensis TaxID=263 RepID=UPI002381BBF9